MQDCTITLSPRMKRMGKNTGNVVKECIEDCTADLLKTATLRTPYKDGGLQDGGKSAVKGSGTTTVGTVSFSAEGKNRFNYAVPMHDDTYNLGDGSLSKSRKGIKSKFSSKTFRVGKGYLRDTAKECQKGYVKYIKEEVIKDLNGR